MDRGRIWSHSVSKSGRLQSFTDIYRKFNGLISKARTFGNKILCHFVYEFCLSRLRLNATLVHEKILLTQFLILAFDILGAFFDITFSGILGLISPYDSLMSCSSVNPLLKAVLFFYLTLVSSLVDIFLKLYALCLLLRIHYTTNIAEIFSAVKITNRIE